MFATPEQQRGGGTSLVTWGIAGLVVLLVLGVILTATRHKSKGPANAVQALDPYAASLAFSDLQMSESSSLSAVKVTYIDGHVTNRGSRTVKGAMVQVLFGNDEQLPPQLETVQLTLVRTHEPYIDTEPVSAAPIKPGENREFRLIFENIGANWNQQLPQIRVVGVD